MPTKLDRTTGNSNGDTTKQCRKRNKKIYNGYLFRFRKDSELAVCIKNQIQYGTISLNHLITKLLCEKFECPVPLKSYDERTVTVIL